MKIKLLNDGGYDSLKGVKFPVLVDGFRYEGVKYAVGVKGSELLRIGGSGEIIYEPCDLTFLIGEECEIVDE